MVLLNCDVGQGILFAGYKHVALQVIASPEEARLITTKPEEILAKQAQIRDNKKANSNTKSPPPQIPAPPISAAEAISLPDSSEQHQEPSHHPSEEGTTPPPAPS